MNLFPPVLQAFQRYIVALSEWNGEWFHVCDVIDVIDAHDMYLSFYWAQCASALNFVVSPVQWKIFLFYSILYVEKFKHEHHWAPGRRLDFQPGFQPQCWREASSSSALAGSGDLSHYCPTLITKHSSHSELWLWRHTRGPPLCICTYQVEIKYSESLCMQLFLLQ